MAEKSILRQRETWFVTNVSRNNITIKDIPSVPVIKPGQRIDLLVYTSLLIAQSSTVIGGYITKGWLYSEEYLHTHDDKSDVGHTHTLDDVTDITSSPEELTQLTDGSNADDLHKHKHNLLEGLNEDDYVHLTASDKTDFTTLTDGSNADDLHTHEGTSGKSKHNELEEIQGGDADNYYHLKEIQHDILTDGSNADSLHTHDEKADVIHMHILSNVTDVTATYTEINQALDGIGSTVTDANLTTLTNLSNADSLHTHSGGGGTSVHNDLTSIQGGSSTQRYHLTLNEHDLLTDGPTSNADSLHTHASISVPDHNDLNGVQGNGADFYHLDSTEYLDLHAELHSIASHSDTSATGIELNTLTDGSNADLLHVHTSTSVTGLTPTYILFGASDTTIDQDSGLKWDDSTLSVIGNIHINSDSNRLYFGTGQESSIYFNGTDLNITLDEPSNPGVINLNDDVTVSGTLTIGSSSIHINGDSSSISSTTGAININNHLQIPSNASRIYFGETLNASIYCDGSDIIFNDPTAGTQTLNDLIGGGGASAFTGLTDTPSSYSGQSYKIVQVNGSSNALVFSDVTVNATTMELGALDLDTTGEITSQGLNTSITQGGVEVLEGNTYGPLEVHQSDASLYWTAAFYNDVYSSSTPIFTYYGYNSGKFSMGTEEATDLAFYTSGYSNERLVISSAGHFDFQAGNLTTTGSISDGILTISDGSITSGVASNFSGLISGGTGSYSGNLTLSSNLNFTDTATQIYEDGSSNLVFKDAITGIKTLAQLAAGGGSGLEVATVSQDAPHGLVITSDVANINCYIADGGLYLDEAVPYLVSGDEILVADIGGTYYCATVFQKTTAGADDSLLFLSGIRLPNRQITVNDNVENNDFTVFMAPASANITATLPGVPDDGKIYCFKLLSATYDGIIGGNGNTIDGASSLTLVTENESVVIQYSSVLSEWAIISINP